VTEDHPKSKDAADPRFHRKLFGSLSELNSERPPCLVYVENGNFNSGYDLLADDYKMAADLIIEEEQRSGLGNWTAPLVFMVRQTLELSLKALLEATGLLGNSVSPKLLFSHRLDALWEQSRDWLQASSYPIEQDRRCDTAEWMITNLHAVDPSGDLFRFAHSKFAAFDRLKTYDRAAVYPAVLIPYFNETYGFLRHWEGVLVNQLIKEEAERQGEPYDGSFNPDDYPRKSIDGQT